MSRPDDGSLGSGETLDAPAIDSLDAKRAYAAVSEALLGTAQGPATAGRFRIDGRLGAGGMGVVYAAFDPELDRKVAIKLLHADSASETQQERMRAEARALARLDHPNIVGVHEIGTLGSRLFIAMELVDGVPLSTWLETPRPWREVADVALQAGRGLAAAHDAGLVHRDFKPANVMLRKDGRAVVLDFGLARIHEDSRARESTTAGAADSGTAETEATAIAGTPAYMAPEQHVGRAATPRSDQFSFCVAIYEAAYGERPFDAKTRIGLLDAIDQGKFRPRPKSRNVPAWFRRILQRGMQPASGDRWPSMEALIEAIEQGIDRPRRRRQYGLVAGGLALASYAAVGTMGGEPEPCARFAMQLQGVWDPEIRGRLDARYEGGDAWPSVRDRIDATGAAWTERWKATCEATHVHGTQSDDLLDWRMACLESDRRALAAAIGHLEDGDQDMVQRAVQSSVFDRAGQRCEADDSSRRVPLPAEGPERDRYHAMLELAAQQRAVAALASDPRGALAVLDALEIDPDTHPDVVFAIEYVRGDVLRELDRIDDAYAAWKRSARAADAAGDNIGFVDSASLLGFVDAQDLHRLDAAEVWIERAKSRAELVELSHKMRFVLGLRTAVVTRFSGDPVTAAKELEALIEQEGPHLGQGNQGVLHHNLAELYGVLGDIDRAADEYRLAIELRSADYGPGHRLVGHSRFQLSRVFIERNEPEQAEKELELAEEIFANATGAVAERIMVADTRAVLAAIQGQLDVADTRMSKAIALGVSELGPNDKRLATLLVNHARILMMLGKHEQAASQVQRGIDVEREAAGAESAGLGDGYSLWAEIEFARGDPGEARRLAQQAADIVVAPGTKLEYRVLAATWAGYETCDAAAATTAVHGLLENAEGDVAEDVIGGVRGAADELLEGIDAFPGCATPSG